MIWTLTDLTLLFIRLPCGGLQAQATSTYPEIGGRQKQGKVEIILLGLMIIVHKKKTSMKDSNCMKKM